MSVAVFIIFVERSGSRNVASAGAGQKDGAFVDEIDAGIIFLDQTNYLCVPLKRLGISSSSNVESIRTSCECVTASLVQYRENAVKTVDALRIDFVKETESTPSLQDSSINLGVEVRMLLSSGLTKCLPIRFVSVKFPVPDLSLSVSAKEARGTHD